MKIRQWTTHVKYHFCSQCPTCLHLGHHLQQARYQEEDFSTKRFLMEMEVTVNGKHMGRRVQLPTEHWVFTPIPHTKQLSGQYRLD